GRLTFQLVSHRLLRWTAGPLALAALIPLNGVLAALQGGLYGWLLLGQAAFYLLAFLGSAFQNRKVPVKGFFVAYYFLMMNWCVWLGFRRYLRKEQSTHWEKALRAA
ncbi:MAG TPA: glycosyl transferase, partial [Cytophagales bacterium]|nr:glycosyl transferase [Cytophagales bacterium]